MASNTINIQGFIFLVCSRNRPGMICKICTWMFIIR